MLRKYRRRYAVRLLPLVALAAVACAGVDATVPLPATEYGAAVTLGKGTARTYVARVAGAPVEIGVALSEHALDGLPNEHDTHARMVHGSHTVESVLTLPAGHGTPFDHVLMNWNPGGHEPPGLYDLPHLDFHFYAISLADRLAIDPADPDYQAKAERVPAADQVPAGYILPEPLAFPQMGVHWVHPASPELNGEVFSRTFIFGSWDGRIIFAEPMVTKRFLESKPNFEAPVPTPAIAEPGQPIAYKVRWDEATREYRIALVLK